MLQILKCLDPNYFFYLDPPKRGKHLIMFFSMIYLHFDIKKIKGYLKHFSNRKDPDPYFSHSSEPDPNFFQGPILNTIYIESNDLN